MDTASKRARFRALHESGCFVIPNPWDIGSARLLQQMGFEALASTSSGHAWTRGRADYAVTLDETLAHLTALSAAVDLPVNADFAYGFAVEPEEVAVHVKRAVASGVSGLSIEDTRPDCSLHELPFATQRIRAARAAIDATGEDVILVGRAEIMLTDAGAVTSAIDKLVAFAEAGADCLYAPGARRKEDIAAIVRAVAPKPVNVLMHGPGLTVAELADLGVRRISVGGALARAAWGAVLAAADKMRAGSFEGLAGAASGKAMNEMFARFRD